MRRFSAVMFYLLCVAVVISSCSVWDMIFGIGEFTISGRIYGTDKVTVTLTGDEYETKTVASSGGKYKFELDGKGDYTVTPSKSGYSFSPFEKTWEGLEDDAEQDFTSSPYDAVDGGKVRLYGVINGAEMVTVAVTGDDTLSYLVERNKGVYEFLVTAGGTYTITPNRDGYIFIPENKTWQDVSRDSKQDFNAQPAQ